MLFSWPAIKDQYARLPFQWKIGILIGFLSVSITSLGFYYYYNASYQMTFSLLQKNLRDVGNVGAMLFDQEAREAIQRLKQKALAEATFDRKIIDSLPVGGTTRTISAEKIKEIHASDDFQMILLRLQKINHATYNEAVPLKKDYALDTITEQFAKGAVATYLMIDLTSLLHGDFGMYIASSTPEPKSNSDPGVPVGTLFKSFFPFSTFNQNIFVADELITDDFYQSLSGAIPLFDQNNKAIAFLGLDYSVGSQLEKLNRMKRICFGLIIVSLLFSLLISFFISKSLSAPLYKLYNAAKRVSEEDYTVSVDIQTKDEFGLLGRVFNKMLADIQASFTKLDSMNRNLENLVAQKTEELQHSNSILDKQANDLEIVLHNQNDFYLRTAHELRTPLTLIRTPVEQLLGEQTDGTKNANLIIIQRAVFRLQRLIDQMLQAAISGRTREVGVQSIDLISTLMPIFELYAKAVEQKNIEFIVEPIPFSAVSINKTALVDIVYNLVSNAIKYSPSGSRVRIAVSLETDRLILEVEDNGPGIPAEFQSKIFEANFRENDSALRDEGYGIGLYTVKQHLERCKGTIALESTPGQGSTFTVTLPCSHTIEKKSEEVSLPDDEPTPHPEQSLAREEPNPSLLIIEDDEDMQQILKNLLQPHYEIFIASNVKEGLQQASEQNPSLILCDVMLPDGSGFDIISQVKQSPETSHIPIIVLTAIGDFPGQKEGWEKGADDYVIKPFANEELLLRITGLLENRKRLQVWYQQKFLLGQNDIKEEISVNTSEVEYLNKLAEQTQRLLKAGNCRLEPLAEAMGQSSRTLQRRLEHLLSQDFTQYVKQVQLKLAKHLLKHGLSINETAYEVGFKDPAYFSKTFKKQFGLSPRDFKKGTGASRQK